MIRIACEADLEQVAAIYASVIAMEEKGLASTGWVRGIYPTMKTAEAALRDQELYVLEEQGVIAASARFNQKQEEAYASIPWLYAAPSEHVMVMHTLSVSPAFQHQGLARRFALWYEDFARERGCTVLRIDTNRINTRARRLYSSLGYREAGIIPTVFNGIEGVDLVCLEKQL